MSFNGSRASVVEKVDDVFNPTITVFIVGSTMFQGDTSSKNNCIRMEEQVCLELLEQGLGTKLREVNAIFYGVMKKKGRTGQEKPVGEPGTTGK